MSVCVVEGKGSSVQELRRVIPGSISVFFTYVHTRLSKQSCQQFCPHKTFAWEDGRVVRMTTEGWARQGD